MNAEDLLKLKKKVSKVKDKKLELQGGLKSQYKQLKKDHDCDDKKSAIKKQTELERNAKIIVDKIEKKVKKINKILEDNE